MIKKLLRAYNTVNITNLFVFIQDYSKGAIHKHIQSRNNMFRKQYKQQKIQYNQEVVQIRSNANKQHKKKYKQEII